MAWIGGTVGAGAAAAASGTHKGSRKHRWFFVLSFVVALIAFLIVISQV